MKQTQKTIEEVLLSIAQNVSKTIRERAFDFGNYEFKKKEDAVTDLDKQIERDIIAQASKYAPANFIGEEYGHVDNGAELTWIIDPIDGTASFMKREFISTVSIGVERKNKLVAGCVADFMRDIIYIASEDNMYGLYRGKKFELPNKSYVKKKSIFAKRLDLKKIGEFFKGDSIELVESLGSFALELAQVASGTHQGMITLGTKVNSWDLAGGCFLLKKDGCYITDSKGDEFDYRHPQNGIIAIRKDAFEEIKPILPYIHERAHSLLDASTKNS